MGEWTLSSPPPSLNQWKWTSEYRIILPRNKVITKATKTNEVPTTNDHIFVSDGLGWKDTYVVLKLMSCFWFPVWPLNGPHLAPRKTESQSLLNLQTIKVCFFKVSHIFETQFAPSIVNLFVAIFVTGNCSNLLNWQNNRVVVLLAVFFEVPMEDNDNRNIHLPWEYLTIKPHPLLNFHGCCLTAGNCTHLSLLHKHPFLWMSFNSLETQHFF